MYESADVAFGTGAEVIHLHGSSSIVHDNLFFIDLQLDPYAEDLDLFPIASTSKPQTADPPGTDIDQSHLPKRDVVVGVYGKTGRKKDCECAVRLNENNENRQLMRR